MNKLSCCFPVLTVSGFAQPAAPDPSNPISTSLRNLYMGNRNNIVRTAEKMPEENYGMRPGAQNGSAHLRPAGVAPWAHTTSCGLARPKGEKNPSPPNLDKLTSQGRDPEGAN